MDLITLLYSTGGLVFGAAFIPQIITLIKDKSGAAAVNLSTWLMFTLCSMITLLYSYIHSSDQYFIFCSSIGTFGNTSVLTLGIMRRLQYSGKWHRFSFY